jgi:hypothetical protein
MSQSPDREWIVREVLARLAAITGVANEDQTPETAAGRGPALPHRVISLELLDERLAGGAELAVRHNAVITPAARDWLRQRGITVVRQAVGQDAGGRKNEAAIGLVGTAFDPRDLIGWAERDGIACRRLQASELDEVIGSMRDFIRQHRCGLILTSSVAKTVCLANRHLSIRAAAVRDLGDADEAIRSLDANLLVADPARHPVHALRHIVARLCRARTA